MMYTLRITIIVMKIKLAATVKVIAEQWDLQLAIIMKSLFKLNIIVF